MKKVGDSVKQDEVIAKIETDKTAVEIAAPTAGVITELLVEEGATITANMPVIKMRAGPGATVPPKPAAPKSEAPKSVAPATSATSPPPPSPPKPVSSSLPEIPQMPKSPASSVPISQIPVTPFKFEAPTGSMDISKIGGSRAETRVSNKDFGDKLIKDAYLFVCYS